MNKWIPTTISLTLLLWSNLGMAGGDAASGKELSATCAACHGVDGNSTDPQYPTLAGQYADYLVRALTDYKSGARKNAIMSSFAGNLSTQDRKDLAAYFSQQKGLHVTAMGRLID